MNTIGEVLVKNNVCCTVFTRIDEIQRLMKENNLKDMPIVDNMLEKHLIGIVSEQDIQAKAKREDAAPEQLSVEQCLRSIPYVKESSDQNEVFNLFSGLKIEKIPVIDREGRYCGFVDKNQLDS
jgi:CBS domain-containing protein